MTNEEIFNEFIKEQGKKLNFSKPKNTYNKMTDNHA